MRLTVRMIASTLAAFAVQSVNADTVSAPSTAAPAPAAPVVGAPATPVASAPAAPASTSSAANSELSAKENALIAKGYKIQVRNGTRVFCKRAEVLGTRLGSVENCGTVDEVTAVHQMSRDALEYTQQHQLNPTGK